MSVKRYVIAGISLEVSYPDGVPEPDNFAPFGVSPGGEAEHVITIRAYGEGAPPPIPSEDAMEIVSEDIVNVLYLDTDGETLVKKTRMRHGDTRVMWTLMNKNDFRRADVFIPDSWLDYTGLANAFMFEKMLVSHGSVMLHCALIEHEGRGIAFTAPSQTGKSTQARLWEKFKHAEQLNGDRAILREIDGDVYAFGSPWAGSSELYINRGVKLSAIVALFQAKENTAAELAFGEALQYFLIGTSLPTWDDELLSLGLSSIEKILYGARLVKLGCTPDKRAVDVLSDYLDAAEGKSDAG